MPNTILRDQNTSLRGQNEAIRRKDTLKQYAEELWADAIKKQATIEEIEYNSRALQDQIYSNRCSNSLILDAFYKLLLPKDEAKMNRSAKELTDHALQSLSKKNNS
jgi:hypothetical protein